SPLFSLLLLFLFPALVRRPPVPTLFPYTTLFRSLFPDSWLSLEFLSACEARKSSASFLDICLSFPIMEEASKPNVMATERISLRSEEHTSELQSRFDLVCRLLLEKKKKSFVVEQR